MGVMVPKFLPIKLVKILLKTGIFHLIFRKFLKVCGMTVKDTLDEISDNEEFKSVVSYIFGDMGRLTFFTPIELSHNMINTIAEKLKARNIFISWYFSFYEQLKFCAQLSGA